MLLAQQCRANVLRIMILDETSVRKESQCNIIFTIAHNPRTKKDYKIVTVSNRQLTAELEKKQKLK